MNIQIIKSKRKTIAIEVTKDLKVLIRAPYRASQKEIDDFVKSKTKWIEKSLATMKQRKEEYSELEKLSKEELEHLVSEALVAIPKKVVYYAEKIGVTYGRITIRNQRTRWGSCSGKGNLNFNCLLMLAPEQVLDYVVVHELCHRKEMNHSERFWKEVEKILPAYKEQREWLKLYGSGLIERML